MEIIFVIIIIPVLMVLASIGNKERVKPDSLSYNDPCSNCQINPTNIKSRELCTTCIYLFN